MHFDLLITNGTVMLPWGAESIAIGVRQGRIAALGAPADATADEVFDATGLHVLPGLIDPHVHLRDPGDASVESIPTGTKAAIKSDATRTYLQWVKDAWDKKLFPPGNTTWDGAGDNNAYLASGASMYECGDKFDQLSSRWS